jgi:hypothetical protein
MSEEVTFEPGSIKKTPLIKEWKAGIDVHAPGSRGGTVWKDRIMVSGETPEQAVHLRDFLLLSIRLAAQEHDDDD